MCMWLSAMGMRAPLGRRRRRQPTQRGLGREWLPCGQGRRCERGTAAGTRSCPRKRKWSPGCPHRRHRGVRGLCTRSRQVGLAKLGSETRRVRAGEVGGRKAGVKAGVKAARPDVRLERRVSHLAQSWRRRREPPMGSRRRPESPAQRDSRCSWSQCSLRRGPARERKQRTRGWDRCEREQRVPRPSAR